MLLMLSPILAAALTLFSIAPPPPADAVPAAAPRRSIEIPSATVEVRSRGEEPRRSLRTKGSPGDRDTLEITVEGLMNTFVDAVRTVNERPIPMHLSITLVVADDASAKGIDSSVGVSGGASGGAAMGGTGEAAGDAPPTPSPDAPSDLASISATIDEVDVTVSPSHDPEIVASTRARLEQLRGETFTLHRRGDGSLRAIELDADLLPEPAGGPDQVPVGSVLDRVVLALVEAFPPLPPEPLGVDAAWSATVDQRRTEIDRMTVTEYVLRSLDDGAATIAVARTVDVREPFQPLSDARIAGATLSRVARMTGLGSGTLSLDANRLVPPALNVQTLLSLFVEGRTIPDGGRTIVHEQEFLGARVPHGTIGSRSAGPAPGETDSDRSRQRGDVPFDAPSADPK